MIELKQINLTKREKILLMLFLGILIAVGLGKFLFVPELNKINDLKSELDSKTNLYNQKIKLGLSDVSLLKERCQDLKSDIAEVNQQVPDVINEPEILVDLYNLAMVNNLQANIIQFYDMKTEKGKNYSYTTVKLKLQGTDKDIYQFVQQMEQYHRINGIVATDFVPEDNVNSSCTFKIAFYTLRIIKEDPLGYSFMKGNTEKKLPYEIFNKYEDKEEVVDGNTDSLQNNLESVPTPDTNKTEKSNDQKTNIKLINPQKN